MTQELINAFTEMREEDVLTIVEDLLDQGTQALEIVDACKRALEMVGQRFEEGQAFVPELIMSGEIMSQVTALVKPRLEGLGTAKRQGKILMGTVSGDIHDIGKEVVVFMLDANGFEVIDLGVDVAPEAFVEKIREAKPDVVGLSGLLTLAFQSMKDTVDTIREAGLRDSVKIMIGGAPVDDHVREFSGADAWGKDAMEAVSLAKQWMGGE